MRSMITSLTQNDEYFLKTFRLIEGKELTSVSENDLIKQYGFSKENIPNMIRRMLRCVMIYECKPGFYNTINY